MSQQASALARRERARERALGPGAARRALGPAAGQHGHGPVTAPGDISAADFKAVFRHHPAGVAVITLRGPDGPVGFTATSVISVSAAPPVLAFSVAATSSARPAVEAAAAVVVNFLAEDQRETAARFATSGIDRFAVRDWLPLPTGEPVLEGTTAWVRGRVEERVPVGDSLLVTVRAELAEHSRRPDPLVYANRAYHQVGPHTRLF